MSYSAFLTKEERKEFADAKQVFEELLDDLNAKRLLRKGTPHSQRERLSKMWAQSRQFGQAFNANFKIFDSRDHVKAFAAKNKNDGINEEVLTGSFLNQTIGLFLYDIETVLKTSLIFFLEEKQGLKKRMELGNLLTAIKHISPKIWPRFVLLIDLELRNALAHGSFWFEAGGEAYLARNSHLEKPKNIKFHEFLIRVKKTNIIAHAFIETLMEKVKQGYFK